MVMVMGRTLVTTMCSELSSPRTMLDRGSSPDGTMTGGNQPTDLRGINRRVKPSVPGSLVHHPDPG